MKLVNASMPGVSWTARALTVTASYTLSDIETATATISGAVTVNGMASLSTSAAAGATQATLAVVAGHVTSTALGTAASPTNVTITGNVTVGGFVQLTSAAYAVVNNVVTTINLTSTAAYNGGKPVVAVLSGNGAFRWAQANSSTAPYYLTGTAGHYQAGSTTAIAVIEQATGGANSPHLFVVGAGSNCDVWVGIQRKE
jgi:hypothetical protein